MRAALLVLLPRLALAQLASPGDLARPHAHLEGLSNCTRCHQAGEQLSPDKCLACHVELEQRVDRRRGFHGHLSESARQKCEECHHEHQGKDARLVEDAAKLDHARTGWPLRGKHAAQKCVACHEPRRLIDADAIALAKRTRTYLGLGTKCTSCHFDEHRGQLDAACEKCHGEAQWKPARFDHAAAAFPLAGKHKSVACAKCHPSVKDEKAPPPFPAPRAATFLKLAPIAHARCTDCHTDPHQSRLGATCESCHSVDGWQLIRNAAEERRFHDKTRFPLKGAHAGVACAACHGPTPGKKAVFRGLPHERCMDCHADAHRGQLARPACERCHTVDGFSPARFELEQHQETKFRLDGAHAAVACSGCHKSELRAAAPPPPRTKAKRAPARREPALSAVAFRLQADRCERCHADPHGGQFSEACAQCHNSGAFADAHFDHGPFPLSGKHAGVACLTCHRGTPVRYRGLRGDCAACHDDTHAGQLGADCARCHAIDGWKPATFRHDTFALDGKHARLACDKCHRAIALPSGKRVVHYKPLPRACEGCHSDAHHGAFRGFEP